jgi:hypothetical protein
MSIFNIPLKNIVFFLFLLQTTNAESLTKNSILVYPNPATEELIIELEGNTEKTAIEVLNPNGQKVYSGFIYDKAIVNTSGFAPGIYLIKTENRKSVEVRKILK